MGGDPLPDAGARARQAIRAVGGQGAQGERDLSRPARSPDLGRHHRELLAGEKGGLGALGLVKQAKALYESAIRIDGNALDGSAYNSLGVLYYKVPGWPIGFGDKNTARELLQKALAINPKGIDPNFFYGEYLLETDQAAEAMTYLQRAVQAPARPGRQVADAGRREEARQLIEKARDKIK